MSRSMKVAIVASSVATIKHAMTVLVFSFLRSAWRIATTAPATQTQNRMSVYGLSTVSCERGVSKV